MSKEHRKLQVCQIQIVKRAMGEISNFYNVSPRLFIFGTHIPPIITIHAAKFQ